MKKKRQWVMYTYLSEDDKYPRVLFKPKTKIIKFKTPDIIKVIVREA